MKTFLKWVGGKAKLVDELKQNFEQVDGTYHEPFLGGGSVLLFMLESGLLKGDVIASDMNETLIDTWIEVRDNPKKLVADVLELASDMSSERYYQVRTEFNNHRTPARFIYLNKLCFRGLWREGPRGFNVPYGNYKSPTIIDESHIMEIHKCIQGVSFVHASWETSLAKCRHGDLVYMDPPYVNTFTGYTRGSWSRDDHVKLFNKIKTIQCNWVMSNSDDKLVTDTFTNIRTIQARRAINSKDPSSTAQEVIVTSH